jgi:hypothetical protein
VFIIPAPVDSQFLQKEDPLEIEARFSFLEKRISKLLTVVVFMSIHYDIAAHTFAQVPQNEAALWRFVAGTWFPDLSFKILLKLAIMANAG